MATKRTYHLSATIRFALASLLLNGFVSSSLHAQLGYDCTIGSPRSYALPDGAGHVYVDPYVYSGTDVAVSVIISTDQQCSVSNGFENISNQPVTTQPFGRASTSITIPSPFPHPLFWTTNLPNVNFSSHSFSAFDGILNYTGPSGATLSGSAGGSDDWGPLSALSTGPHWNAPPGSGYPPIDLTVNSRCTIYAPNIGAYGNPTFQNSGTLSIRYIHTVAAQSYDCDGDQLSDQCGLLLGAPDNNQDGHPDICPPVFDCDSDGDPDDLEIYLGAPDCNQNLVPDDCDLANPALDQMTYGTPPTCVPNGILDACENLPPAADCNANNVFDVCDITAGTVADLDNDFVPDLCQGKVLWDVPMLTPLRSATIRAYWIGGTAAAPIFNVLPPDGTSPVSNAIGKYVIPREYFSAPQQAGELARGVRAEISYTEVGGNLPSQQYPHTIVNYPGWDPLQPIRSAGSAPDRTIRFPAPIIMQAGVWGQTNGGSADQVRDFYTLDSTAGGSSANSAAIKRGTIATDGVSYLTRPIPSFLFFALPSKPHPLYPDDGVPWGYDNSPVASPGAIEANAYTLQTYFSQRVNPIVNQYAPDQVPSNLLAHSMGGVISRKWIKQGYASAINRYVSLDGVQGGTGVLGLANLGPWLSESGLNGTSLVDLMPPSRPGWNYSHPLNTDPSYALYASLDDMPDVINPYTSAFGIGRTILRGYPSSYEPPNGHCKRFLGGWEIPVTCGTHSIQSCPAVVVSTARFFAYGDRPSLSGNSDPGGVGLPANTSLPADSPIYSPVGCQVTSASTSPVGQISTQINALANTQAVFELPINTSGTVVVGAYVSDANATLSVHDAAGLPIAKSNESNSPLAGSGYFTSFESAVTAGANSLHLTAGASNAAVAITRVTFPGDIYLTTWTTAETYQPNSSVSIRATLQDVNGIVIPSGFGNVSVNVFRPNGSPATVTLFDDGAHGDGAAADGVFAGNYTITSEPGQYRIETLASLPVNGGVALRQAQAGFEILSDGATIQNVGGQYGDDNNSNGRIESWNVDFTVDSLNGTNVRLIAELMAGPVLVRTLDSIVWLDVLSPVTQPITIDLNTLHSLPPGPYTLASIRIVDLQSGQQLDEVPPLTLNIPPASQIEQLPPPTLSYLTPNFGSFAGGNQVLIKGLNLLTTERVRFGASNAQFEVNSDDTITVTVPRKYMQGQPALVGSPSSQPPQPPVVVSVKVRTSGGSVTLPSAYTYLQ